MYWYQIILQNMNKIKLWDVVFIIINIKLVHVMREDQSYQNQNIFIQWHWVWLKVFQWLNPVYNNTDKYFSIRFLNVFSATTIGGPNTGYDTDDSAPRIRYLTNEFINVTSGYSTLVNSRTNFTITIGK